MKKIYIFAFTFLLMFSFVSAAPPFSTTTEISFPEGFEIIEAQQSYLQTNHDFTYNFFVYNSSDGQIKTSDDGVNCCMFVVNSYGELLLNESVNSDITQGYWYLDIDGDIINYSGEYSYGVSCHNGVGGALAGTFITTIDGQENSIQNFLLNLLLIVFIIGLILIIKHIHSNTDFDEKRNKVIDSNKNVGQKMATMILQSLFKNSFIWVYSLGWFIVFILKDMVLRFSSVEIYGYFELFANVYSLGFLLVIVYMIGFTINYMKNSIEILTDKDWGVSQ